MLHSRVDVDKDHGRWSRFTTRHVGGWLTSFPMRPVDLLFSRNACVMCVMLSPVEVFKLFYEFMLRFLFSPQDPSLVRCPNPPLVATAALLGHVVNELSEGQSEYELALELVDLVHLLM